jgi:hypothetical protein
MDFVKKAAEGIKGNSGENKDQAAQAQGGEQQDYVDKGNFQTSIPNFPCT